MGSSSSTRKRHSDVTSASRSSPHFGVLALVNRRSPQTEQPKEPSDKDTENAKISVAKLYEQRYRPAFRGIGAQYNGKSLELPFLVYIRAQRPHVFE